MQHLKSELLPFFEQGRGELSLLRFLLHPGLHHFITQFPAHWHPIVLFRAWLSILWRSRAVHIDKFFAFLFSDNELKQRAGGVGAVKRRINGLSKTLVVWDRVLLSVRILGVCEFELQVLISLQFFTLQIFSPLKHLAYALGSATELSERHRHFVAFVLVFNSSKGEDYLQH